MPAPSRIGLHKVPVVRSDFTDTVENSGTINSQHCQQSQGTIGSPPLYVFRQMGMTTGTQPPPPAFPPPVPWFVTVSFEKKNGRLKEPLKRRTLFKLPKKRAKQYLISPQFRTCQRSAPWPSSPARLRQANDRHAIVSVKSRRRSCCWGKGALPPLWERNTPKSTSYVLTGPSTT